MDAREAGNHHTTYRVEKFHDGELEPYEVIEGEENILVNSGIDLLLDLLIGAGGTDFSAAYLGVGSSSTAASAGQTDLQGVDVTKIAMDATYPSRSGETLTFKSTFGSGDANHSWQEWGVFNGPSGTMLNRKVQNFGLKSGGTWVLTATITIS